MKAAPLSKKKEKSLCLLIVVFCGIFPHSRPCRYCALCRRNVLSQMIASAISCVLSVKHTQNATRFVCLKKL